MKLFLCIGLMFLFAGNSMAYITVDCDVDVRVDNRITNLDTEQKIGSERINCDGGEMRIMRMVKTDVSVTARAEASARADADAYYSDSCSCSGSGCGTCHTSGSGSDYDRDSDSDSTSRSKTAETKFVVARVSFDSLRKMGFSVTQNTDSCRLLDDKGRSLNTLKAIAVITRIYGEELLKEYDADFNVFDKFCGCNQPNLQKIDNLGGIIGKSVSFDGAEMEGE